MGDRRERSPVDRTVAVAIDSGQAVAGARVTPVLARSILTPATGFMSDYDFTLNPYSGCSFGCTYCYAAFFGRTLEKRDNWGYWVEVKENALELLRRMRRDFHGATVYMSSVTDPYQFIERRLGLVRSLLPVLAERGVRLVVQTRSPLVVRDVDLFRLFDSIRINMTVTTDTVEVERAFEPGCPTNAKRLDAIAAVVAAGLPTAITITPLLPVTNAVTFAAKLLATGVSEFTVQPFHAGSSKFIAGTGERARALLRQFNWDDAAHAATVEVLRRTLPSLRVGKAGFAPA